MRSMPVSDAEAFETATGKGDAPDSISLSPAPMERHLRCSLCPHTVALITLRQLENDGMKMNDEWQSLRSVFSSGHCQLEAGLRGMIDAIRTENFPLAANLAEDLDRTSGPHVEFEERYLFPLVEEEAGEAYATRLYDDHAELLGTLVEVQRLKEVSCPSPKSERRWLESLERGLERLSDTRRLLRYLGQASAEEKTRMLQRHHLLHRRAHRWSQLHPISDQP